MKLILLTILLFTSNNIKAHISMDEDTLSDGEVATLIYTLGCGDWENFTFSITNNTINAFADVPKNWFTCNIDPAPPQFWNRLPLTQLPVGDYTLNITLAGPTQSETNQLDFSVIGGSQIQSVPIDKPAGLILLVTLLLLSSSVFTVSRLNES